jgi:signal transduction histidine kinase
MQLRREQSSGSPPTLLTMASLDPRQQEWRINLIERDIGLPVRAVLIVILSYYLFLSNWMSEVPVMRDVLLLEEARHFAQNVVQAAFLVYLAVNVAVAFVLLGRQKLPAVLIQWAVFSMALIDGLFLAGMVTVTGGIKSTLYWLYLVLVLRNSLSFTATAPQLLLNSLMCLFYVAAVMLDVTITEMDQEMRLANTDTPEAESGLDAKRLGLHVLLLVCVGAWCYGMQVLLDRQRRSLEEQRELALRREQLQASGRLAAEIAHQLKNPLSIINNAAFTLQRTLKEGKTITQQIKIIREEVERSDRLITQLMGYAQLVEGRVEKLNVAEELERAILQVFPPAVKYEIQVHRDYAPALPDLLAQRNHLSEIFVNIMQNAREAMNGRGNLWVSAAHGDGVSVVITIGDDGPGIGPEYLDKVFEPYFSTREKGSGLGLAIVKHNAQLYGGKVSVESELGKGTRFVLEFPARTLMELRK